MFLLNLLNSVLILICYILNNYYHPLFSTISFLTFIFPILVLINISFFVYWSIKLDLKVIFPFVIIIFLFYNSFSFFRMGDKKKSELNGFQIMSFNARLFNHYKWIENDSIPFATEKFFKKNIPDVLSIQEYHGDYQYLLNNYKNKYIYFSGDNVGQSIHTNNQIINKGLVEFNSSVNNAIFIDIIQKKDTLRIYNAHFESFKVDMQDLKADLISLKSVISKMKKTYLSQNEQSKILLDHISKSPYKIILTVDLNNTEYSFVYKQIGSILKDAFDLKGIGFGSTYDFRFMPIRIDYIFISKSLSAKKFKIFDQKISDHMPISVFMDI